MNRKTFLIGLAIVALVGLFAIGATPNHKVPTDPEVCAGTSGGGGSTCTFASPTFSLAVTNLSATATDSFTVKLNGDTDTFTLYGGETFSLSDADGFATSTVVITAVSGTPGYRIIGLELN